MDKIITQIGTLLTSYVKTARSIKEIYEGDTFNIPLNSLPAIIIRPSTTQIEKVDSQNDQRICDIDIVVVLDARSKFNVSSTKANGLTELVKIIEESNTNMSLKSDTVLYALRHYLDCDISYLLKLDINSVEYPKDINERREFPTLEAVIRITATSKLYLR